MNVIIVGVGSRFAALSKRAVSQAARSGGAATTCDGAVGKAVRVPRCDGAAQARRERAATDTEGEGLIERAAARSAGGAARTQEHTRGRHEGQDCCTRRRSEQTTRLLF